MASCKDDLELSKWPSTDGNEMRPKISEKIHIYTDGSMTNNIQCQTSLLQNIHDVH